MNYSIQAEKISGPFYGKFIMEIGMLPDLTEIMVYATH